MRYEKATAAIGIFALAWSVSLSAHALPKLADGCHYTPTGTIECEDDITVTPTVSECEKHPWNCIPSRPPTPPSTGGGNNTGGGGGVGPNPVSTFEAIASMTCTALQQTEDRYKEYVKNLENSLAMEQKGIEDRETALKSDYYSDATIKISSDAAKDICDAYELMKNARAELETCTGVQNGKPERCTTPSPSGPELRQLEACRSANASSSAIRNGRTRLENEISSLRNESVDNRRTLAKDREILKEIQKQQREKKCAK